MPEQTTGLMDETLRLVRETYGTHAAVKFWRSPVHGFCFAAVKGGVVYAAASHQEKTEPALEALKAKVELAKRRTHDI